jgi:hypothetical protein
MKITLELEAHDFENKLIAAMLKKTPIANIPNEKYVNISFKDVLLKFVEFNDIKKIILNLKRQENTK